MKKLLTLILVLVGYVGSVSADWYVRGTFNSWDVSDEWKMSANGAIYTLVSEGFVSDGSEQKFKIDNGSWGESYPSSDYVVTIPAGTYDLYFYFDSGDAKTVSINYIDKSVDLRGDWGKWGTTPLTLTRSSAWTYTGTLDLSKTIQDQKFKFVLGGSDWKGFGDGNLTVTDNDLISDETDGKTNLILLNSNKTYKTYNVTAVWTPSTNTATGWTLTIAGDDARTNDDYSVTFVKGRDWSTVNAYVYSALGDNNDKVVAWPGTTISKTGTTTADNGLEYDVYTYAFKSYFVPETIIFNDGTYQTADLTFTNGKKYNETVPTSVYAVVGANVESDGNASNKAIFSGYWDAANTTDFMTLGADGVTYFLNKVDQALTPQTLYAKVIKKATTTTANENVDAWYPTANNTLAISETGKYDITYTFNTENGAGLWDASAVTSSATLKSIPVTISSEGKSTFSSSHALNFDGKGISAYMITGASGGALTISDPMTLVPANTGLYLERSGGTTEYIPVVSEASVDVSSNYLVAGSGSEVAATDGDYTNFILTNKTTAGSALLKFYKANGNTVPAGKAYLHIPTAMVGARESLWFAEETTSIDAVKQGATMLGQVYNLNGQRVAQPQKGLYIVNGKKVIIK